MIQKSTNPPIHILLGPFYKHYFSSKISNVLLNLFSFGIVGGVRVFSTVQNNLPGGVRPQSFDYLVFLKRIVRIFSGKFT